jgi:hypothetical protein
MIFSLCFWVLTKNIFEGECQMFNVCVVLPMLSPRGRL